MPNASVHDFPSAGAYTGLEGVDTFYYWDDDAGEPRQLSLTELVKYALGNKTIGGVAAGDIATIDASQTFTNKALTTPSVNGAAISTATGAEINYCDGVTSAIQTQINAKASLTQLAAKANLASPTFTGTVVLPSTTSIGNVSSTEIGYLDGVTSGIQVNINSLSAAITGVDANKAPITSPTFTGTVVLPATTSIGNVSATELGYLDGVSGAIQTQITALAELIAVTNYPHCYSLEWSTGGETTKYITQAMIIAGIAQSGHVVLHNTISCKIYEMSGTYVEQEILASGGIGCEISDQTVGTQKQLDTIAFTGLTAETKYLIVIYLKIAKEA